MVEDNELNYEIGRELLNQSGLETGCVADGQQAVELFTSNPPGSFALVLTDIQMPVLDGYGVTRAIRSLGKTAQRPDTSKIAGKGAVLSGASILSTRSTAHSVWKLEKTNQATVKSHEGKQNCN